MAEPPKYRILHELGAGGMGTVCKGLLVGQAGFQRPIVIKQLKNPEPDHLRLFVEEARRYALLDHENIGRIFDFEEVRGELCIILEYIDGWTLVDYLERQRQLGGAWDVEMAAFIVSRVCRALQYVFERAAIVHRDISPSNIMMTSEGTVKLIDFGIATRSGTRDSCLTGKPAYMAPEMVVEMRADHRSDLFSLGTVFYEMLTGNRLFRGATTSDVLAQVVAGDIPSLREKPYVPEAVAAILEHALERDPGRRFASAAAMGEACEHFLYDKGYGPTNLTLKRRLAVLFPNHPAAIGPDLERRFPLVESTLIPIGEGTPSRDGATQVSLLDRTYARVVAQREADVTPTGPTLAAATRPNNTRARTASAPAARTATRPSARKAATAPRHAKPRRRPRARA
jgi:eukaryotic-like serine/threonine-protein kinase